MQTFTRAYDSYEKAKQAVNNLEKIGIPAADISVVANKRVSENHEDVRDASEAASGAGLGAALGGGAGLLAGLGMMAIPGLGPVVAVGWLASTALGVVAGSAAGGLIGALINAGTSEADSHVYSETVRRGGTLVTIRTDHPSDKIEATLDGYQPVDPKVRRAEYQQTGWTGFDPDAPDYLPDEIEIEKRRRRQV